MVPSWQGRPTRVAIHDTWPSVPPDPDPNERDDDGTPQDPLRGIGGSFGPADGPGSTGFGMPGAPSDVTNPGWLTEIELAEARRCRCSMSRRSPCAPTGWGR